MTRILINTNYCKGCGICVEICPVKVFKLSEEVNEKGYHIANPINHDKCIKCHLCELYCPDQAIYVED